MSPKRKRVAEYGMRGRVRCIVVRDGDRYIVERYVGGKARRKKFNAKDEALVYADGWYKAATSVGAGETNATPEHLTLRELFDRYFTVQAKKHDWRGSTLAGYRNHRVRIEEVLLPNTLADKIGVQHIDHLWVTLTTPSGDRKAMVPNQVMAKVKLLGRMLEWAAARDMIQRNPVPAWDAPEVAKAEIKEYAPAQGAALLAQFDYTDAWEWRPWAVIMIAGSHGFRANALLNLRWTDLDLEAARINLAKATDKTKRDWSRPMTWEAHAALLTARHHADRLGKHSPYVFYGKRDRPYTYQAFWKALLKAEARAGIAHVPLRAAHGLRRMVVNDVRQRTGDAALGLLWVGDKDLRQAGSYVRTRDEEMEAIASGAELPRASGED